MKREGGDGDVFVEDNREREESDNAFVQRERAI